MNKIFDMKQDRAKLVAQMREIMDRNADVEMNADDKATYAKLEPPPLGEVARSDGEGFVYKKHVHSWLFIISSVLFYGRVVHHNPLKELQS